MFDKDKWQEIFFTIKKNKLRTFLTAFSVSWGIFILIVLLGAGSGLQNGVENQFQDDATNSIWLRPRQTSLPFKGMQPGRQIQFTNEDYETIKNQVPGVEFITSRYRLEGEYTVRYKDKYSSFNVRSCHPDHKYLENTIIISGRFLNDADLKERRKVTAIGTEIVTILFGDKDPIGEWIDVGGIKYKVVGVYNDSGGENELRNIYIPITTAQTAYGGGNEVHQIMFTTGNATLKESKEMERKAVDLLATEHIFSPQDPRAIGINNNVENFQKFMSLFEGIRVFLWIIGAFTIIAGVVGVGNIMLISVKERTREIGVRKALGATPRSIIGLILTEAVFITLIAGYVGLLLGVGLIELIGWAIEKFNIESGFFMNPEIDLLTALTALVVLVVAGGLAGYFPARKAAAIPPIEALRDE